MKEEFKALIDKRNEDLWHEMNEYFKITLKENSKSGYLTNFSPEEVTIYIDKENMGPAPFTHELLHLYIKQKQTLILEDFSERTEDDHELLHLFSQKVVNHICNCLEHFKMLPMYLGMGFEKDHFTKDFHKQMMDQKDMERITGTYLKNGIYDGKAVQDFMGKFFSMKSSPNKSFDYETYFTALSQLDAPLYGILDRFWDSWLTFKIGNPPEEYQAMLDTFLGEMREWIKGKTLIY
ncbi:hypothetical protein QRD02_13515 [Aequorivita sp. SDUM287046]|uniref:Uncharacterized protein n=1 Tax=Aequorivita aurantiaca TaxID=3053356 RepID=A0ABT8DJ39_9FLAO|nr:hypothetical protein [Aequorivita aurantiaca]MDN3725401.1 hypothetical protein [Aequorivita aurantiaca]